MAEPKDMWRCQMVNCGYVYDPDRGDKRHKIPAGTRFEDLPEDWKCPVCGATKKSFRPFIIFQCLTVTCPKDTEPVRETVVLDNSRSPRLS